MKKNLKVVTLAVTLVILTGAYFFVRDNPFNYGIVKKEFNAEELVYEFSNFSSLDLQLEEMSFYHEEGTEKSLLLVEMNEYIQDFSPIFSDDDEYDYVFSFKNGVMTYGNDDESLVFDFNQQTIDMTELLLLDTLFMKGDDASQISDIVDKNLSSEEEVILDNTRKIVSLLEYGMEIIYDDGKYYVPISLVNLFFTGYETKIIYRDGKAALLEVANVFNHVDSLFEFSSGNSTLMSSQKDQILAANYYDFLLENYYGLELELDTDAKTDELASSNQYFSDLGNLFVELEDPHSTVIFNVGANDDDRFNVNYYNYFEQSYYNKWKCDERSTIAAQNLGDGVGYINVPSFGEANMFDTYVKEMEKISENDKIILDISCNIGGYLGNTLLFYAGAKPEISTHFFSINDGRLRETSKYLGKKPLENKDLYLVTSNVTFSAGNMAASIFADEGFGKIIGEKTSGGSAAVGYIIGHDGSLLTLSNGSIIISNSDYEYIEDGVEVDIAYDYKSTYLKDLKEIANGQ